MESRVGQLQRQVAVQSGYEIRWPRMEFYGLCPACQNRARPNMAAV